MLFVVLFVICRLFCCLSSCLFFVVCFVVCRLVCFLSSFLLFVVCRLFCCLSSVLLFVFFFVVCPKGLPESSSRDVTLSATARTVHRISYLIFGGRDAIIVHLQSFCNGCGWPGALSKINIALNAKLHLLQLSNSGLLNVSCGLVTFGEICSACWQHEIQ